MSTRKVSFIPIIFLPYIALVLNLLDDIIMGFVLGYIDPFTAMPVWYFPASILGAAACFILIKDKNTYKEIFTYWKFSFGYIGLKACTAIGWFFGIYYLGISGNTLIDQFQHIILILYGVIAFKEKLSIKKRLGAGILYGGLILFSFGAENASDWLGILFAAMMAISSAFATILQKHAADKVNHTALVTLRSWVMLILAFALGFYMNTLDWSHYDISPAIWIALIIGSCIGPGLLNLFAMASLKHVPLSTYTFVMMITPIVLILIGILFYNDPVNEIQISAIALVMLGKLVILTQK